VEIREAKKLGITAELTGVDFTAIMDRVRAHVGESRDRMQQALQEAKEFDYYPDEARFTGAYTLDVK
jgi:pyruvate/2-oxoglutarate dehydrogenase complex dihydrolipoamide dehydrogenase (E3) component